MRSAVIRKSIRCVVAIIAFMMVTGTGRAATTVEPGFDLFVTDPSTSLNLTTIPNPQLVNFEGNPLGTFDFGSGAVGVDDADTIVERTQLANLGGGSSTIDIEIVALSLVSTGPVDLGFGAGFEDVFLILNTSSPSLQSNRTIFDTGEGDPHGSFDSVRNFSFDLLGSVGGFYATIEVTLTTSSNGWRHEPGNTVIDGVNHLLNGIDEDADSWPTGSVLATGGFFDHVAAVAAPPPSVPSLGATGISFVVSLLGLIGWQRVRDRADSIHG